jgi:hypothetical protein
VVTGRPEPGRPCHACRYALDHVTQIFLVGREAEARVRVDVGPADQFVERSASPRRASPTS